MNWQDSVCMSIGVSQCPNVGDFVEEGDAPKASPIDVFYKSITDIVTKADPVFFMNYGEDIAGLLFVGLISATENYFRDVLGATLSLCPISQAYSSDEKVQLGSLLWGPRNLYNRSAFEFMAFSNAKNVKETFQKFTKHTIAQHGLWNAMLDEYDKLCEFRHAVVHSGHLIAGKNAVKLKLKPTKKVLKFKITYALLQSSARVCTSFVQAANNELFEMLVKRWADDWRKLPSWSIENESDIKKIYAAFLSNRDNKNKSISNKMSFSDFEAKVRASYGIS